MSVTAVSVDVEGYSQRFIVQRQRPILKEKCLAELKTNRTIL